ncbi:uncharacterized protein, partial [Epargyreus clarus]|uniref:uncharacterized protein n=1 Tax=Epargyreus clarus TaxID=520877 RepID=UPI003C2E2D77
RAPGGRPDHTPQAHAHAHTETPHAHTRTHVHTETQHAHTRTHVHTEPPHAHARTHAYTQSPVRNAVLTINARCNGNSVPYTMKKRKDLDMVHKKQTITVYNIEDNVDFERPSRPRTSAYKVVPCDREVEERCELIKNTYDVISKYTRAMFDKQNETVV